MKTAEQNYRLIQEIEASRLFLLTACQQNPKLLERSDERIKQILGKTAFDDYSIPQPSSHAKPPSLKKQSGISLIELIMFMVIISIAVIGVLQVMNRVSGNSVETLLRKQALAVAESLLEEVELQDFTSVAGATPLVTLANRSTVYHIVTDYAGFAASGVFSASTGAPIAGLGGYNVEVDVTPTALGVIPPANSLLITVTVTDPRGAPNTVQISGYRTSYR